MSSKNRERDERRFVVGISGASGSAYAVRLIQALLRDARHHVHLIVTPAGQRVMKDELARGSGAENFLELTSDERSRLHAHPCADIGAGPASGTFRFEAMVVIPCSMNTLASIAHGLESNLLLRAAAVTLKEGRPLILVPRETPLGLIELRNMVAVTEAGAVMLPANPGFYHRPRTVGDLVDFVAQKVMDRLGIEMPGAFRWEGQAPKAAKKKPRERSR